MGYEWRQWIGTSFVRHSYVSVIVSATANVCLSGCCLARLGVLVFGAAESETSIVTGLGVASLDMFMEGLFSSDGALKTRTNSLALRTLTEEQLGKGLQVTETNQIIGLGGRTTLLNKLGAG